MNKLRIFIFLFFAAILFAACKSIPQAPAEEFTAAESPDAPSAPEEMPPAENPPTSEGTSTSEGTALSLPTTEAESAPENAGMDEEDLPPEKPKTTLSLKPKTSVDSGKTAVSKENAEKLLSARPRLRPRLAPVNTVRSESSADSSAADTMPVASETAALSPASSSEVQVSAAAVKVQDKIEPKTETADKGVLVFAGAYE